MFDLKETIYIYICTVRTVPEEKKNTRHLLLSGMTLQVEMKFICVLWSPKQYHNRERNFGVQTWLWLRLRIPTTVTNTWELPIIHLIVRHLNLYICIYIHEYVCIHVCRNLDIDF